MKSDIEVTNQFLKNLLCTYADKGNVTVLVEREKNLNDLEKILSDTTKYELIQKDYGLFKKDFFWNSNMNSNKNQ